jgi:protein-S-isoprenylcysteine O-methyltransferase Ste14
VSAAPAVPPRRTPLVLLGVLVTTAFDVFLLAVALGGLSALLAHRPALALLAVWLVGALALAWRRPVQARSGAQRSGDPLLMVALLFLPWLAAPVAALGERLGLWPFGFGGVRVALGLALAAAGLALRIAAMSQLGTRFDPTVAIQQEHALETRGLYARVRHPGYSGAWLAALGGALVFDSALGLPLVLLMGVALAARVRREERALEAHFGDDWRAYRARTGAFAPRF